MSSDSIKIVVVGTGGVGKSAMTLRFVKNEWVSKVNVAMARRAVRERCS